MSSTSMIINFSPGPSKIPEAVLEKAQKEFLNYGNLGLSVMEMSHRSADFSKILNTAEQNLRELMDIPLNYKVLFLPGGACGQFAGIPMNLMNLKPGKTTDYIVTGCWSAKAAKEAEKYGKVNLVTPKVTKYTGIPDFSTWNMNPEASYIFMCSNETVHGIEFNEYPDVPEGVPIVLDMSSNILSRPIDVSKFGVIFGGAQKNTGCAGVTICIIREDLIGHASNECPSIFDWKLQAGSNSLYNTPPTYSIYILGLCLDWMKEEGGVNVMEGRSIAKSKAVYDAINRSNGFYSCAINPKDRSRMNVTFRIGCEAGIEELEKKFVDEASKLNMKSLKGHRSVGGIRASLYNAITIEETSVLVRFMEDFQLRHQSV